MISFNKILEDQNQENDKDFIHQEEFKFTLKVGK